MNEKNNRSRIVGIRLTDSEYGQLDCLFKKTTCQKLSDYIRQVILSKPTVITYRNVSVDDFMAEMVLLRKELNAIGSNLNQVVRKLNTLSSSEGIRELLLDYEEEKGRLARQVEGIRSMVEKAVLLW